MRNWKDVGRRIIGGAFARNVLTVGGAAALGQALVLLASPVLTRLYDPAEFGVLAIYASTVGILFAIICLRYEIAIPLPEREEDAAALATTAWAAVALISLLVAAGLAVGGSWFTELVKAPELRAYLWLIPVGVFGGGTYRVLNYWAVRKKSFTAIARTKLSQNVSMLAAQLGLGGLGAGAVGLLIGDVLGRAGGCTTLYLTAVREDRRLFRRLKFKNIRRIAWRYRRFPFFSSGAALLNSAALQAPALVLAALYGTQVTGWFALSQRICNMPAWLVSQAVNQVYLGEAARMAREDPAALQALYKKISIILLGLGLLPAFVLGLAGPVLFAFVFGESWSEAGVYAQFFALAFIGQFVVAPVSMTLNMLEQQETQLLWDAGRFVTVMAVLLACAAFDWSARAAVMSYSAVLFLSYAVLWRLSFTAIKRQTVKVQ